MKINSKYRIEGLSFNFQVIDALDFSDEPLLLLERDNLGNRYISYLIENDRDNELRAYIQISKRRFNEIISQRITVNQAFLEPENDFIILTKFSLHTGELLESALMPSQELDLNFISENYYVFYDSEEILEDDDLVTQSVKAQKLIFDFYLHGQNLIESIKPYAIYKVFTPIVEIIKDLLGFDNRNADKILSFSNLRHSSLGVTIELNFSKDLFFEKEDEALQILTYLLNAEKKEDFEQIVVRTKNTKFITQYKSIIKAVIENNANLHTSYANPVTQEVKKSYIDKEKALKAKEVVEESFDLIEDIEEIRGKFLEIDLDAKEPSFKILPNDEDTSIKGKFELSIIDKLKEDLVNLGKEEYMFTVKTIYYPETVVKSEEVKRFMIEYKKTDSSQ